MKKEIPQGVQTIAELTSENPNIIWAGLKSTLNTPDKIASFNKIVEETVAQMKGQGDNIKIAIAAMSAAGEAILGPNRPSAPDTTEAFLGRMKRAGIIRRVEVPQRKGSSSRRPRTIGGVLRVT